MEAKSAFSIGGGTLFNPTINAVIHFTD